MTLDDLSDFFDRHSAVELLDQGIMEVDPDTSDLDRMLAEYRIEGMRRESVQR